jgi:hypothetical protein
MGEMLGFEIKQLHAGLKITAGQTLDMVSGQIDFSSDIPHLWPVI